MKYRMNFVSIPSLIFVAAIIFAGSGSVCVAGSTPSIQQGPGRGPITVPRDPELEKQSYRHLEVAKFYFYKRKPEKSDKDGWERLNKAVESRLQEVIDTNPNFAGANGMQAFLLDFIKNPDQDLAAFQKKIQDFWDTL